VESPAVVLADNRTRWRSARSSQELDEVGAVLKAIRPIDDVMVVMRDGRR
jgi:hypothetical protein